MRSKLKTIKSGAALANGIWRETAAFFLSIEFWLLMAVAGSLVGGVWLAFMGDLRSLLAFGFVIAYFTARPLLHVKGILKWPFF